MKRFDLFTKNVASFTDVEKFVATLESHNIKRSITLNEEKYKKHDTLLAYTGTTQKGDLIAIWSRVGSKRRSADYGVRISNALIDKLSATESIKALLSNAKYEDSDESRISFSSLADVELFFNTLFAYTDVMKSKKTTKAVETVESVIA